MEHLLMECVKIRRLLFLLIVVINCVESLNNSGSDSALPLVPSLTEELSEQELSSQLHDVDTRSGGWSSWSEWSPCSRSCDGGVSHQIRTCNTASCRGENIRHKICNMQVILSIIGYALVEGNSFAPSRYDFNYQKTFFPIVQVESTTPSKEIIVPHQEYGLPTKPPKPHEVYGLPNKEQIKPHPHMNHHTPKTFYPIFEVESTTPSKEHVVPHQEYGLPISKPHKKYYLSKGITQYSLPFVEPPKTFFPVDFEINEETIVESLAPLEELIVPHTEPPKPQEIQKPPKPHEVYGIPNVHPTKPNKEHPKPHQVQGTVAPKSTKPLDDYGTPNVNAKEFIEQILLNRIFEDYKSQILQEIFDISRKKNVNKIPKLKFKYVPYIEYVDRTTPEESYSTHNKEVDPDYW